jgi:hypothetical protein
MGFALRVLCALHFAQCNQEPTTPQIVTFQLEADRHSLLLPSISITKQLRNRMLGTEM